MEDRSSSANFLGKFPMQKKVLFLWPKMHKLYFYFVGQHWSSANFFTIFPMQKKVLCVWSKMHILHFDFVGQTHLMTILIPSICRSVSFCPFNAASVTLHGLSGNVSFSGIISVWVITLSNSSVHTVVNKMNEWKLKDEAVDYLYAGCSIVLLYTSLIPVT